jgi:cyclophilin family peptidyl-prolyl cis-trans isomerase
MINRGTPFVWASAVEGYDPITNEYGVGRRFSNVYGTIAMARQGGVTNSASSSWFFNLDDNSFLDDVDGGFTVFGHVVRGSNVLEKFVSVEAATNAGIAAITDNPFHIDWLPIIPTNASVTPEDVVFLNIELLEVQVEPGIGGTTISWNSTSNALQVVEYSVDPAANEWMELAVTNGTGGAMQAVDSYAGNEPRCYRVRMAY